MRIEKFILWFKDQLVAKGLIPEHVELLVGITDDKPFDQFTFLDNGRIHITRDGQSIVRMDEEGDFFIFKGVVNVPPRSRVVYTRPMRDSNHAKFWISYDAFLDYYLNSLKRKKESESSPWVENLHRTLLLAEKEKEGDLVISTKEK